jgi:type III restriction enzyme
MATLDFKGKALVQNYHLTVKYHELGPKKDKSLTDKVRLDDKANPNRVWAFIPETMAREIVEGRVMFPDKPSGRPMVKRYRKNLKSDVNPLSTWIRGLSEVGNNEEVTTLSSALTSEGGNPASKNNLTQLIGRILRQPSGRKTKVKDLDESYVFCFRQSAKSLVESVRVGFGQEGLGDLAGQVVMDSPDDEPQGEETIELRDRFKKFAGKIYLPTFVIRQGSQWREVNYETDIVSRIDWAQADFSPERNLQLAQADSMDAEIVVTLGDTKAELVKEQGRKYLTSAEAGVDVVFATRQLLEVIPNPWIAHDITKDIIATLTRKNGLEMVANNFVFIVQELVKRVTAERDRLAEEVFARLVYEKQLRFLLLKDDAGYRLPNKIKLRKGARKLTREDNSPLQMSLFEQVAEDCVNGDERSVAWYFDKQGQLLWWYRNLSRQDYRIQGWRKHGIFPDFIASRTNPADKTDFDKVFVVESKGIHLKNEDTDYKKKIFKLCNKLAEEKSWTELGLEFPERKIVFELVFGDEWQKKLNELLK